MLGEYIECHTVQRNSVIEILSHQAPPATELSPSQITPPSLPPFTLDPPIPTNQKSVT